MIALKNALFLFIILYSGYLQAENTGENLNCSEIEKVRCLEVQEYGHEFVGPKFDEYIIEEYKTFTRPSTRELICCGIGESE